MSFRERLLALAMEHEDLMRRCVALERQEIDYQLKIHATGGIWPPQTPEYFHAPLVPLTPKGEPPPAPLEARPFVGTSTVSIGFGTRKNSAGSTNTKEVLLTVLAWKECHFDFEVFWKSFIYELFPTIVSGPLCWLLEGLESAKNRSLMYSWACLKHPFNIPIVMDLFFTLGPWAVLAMWFIQPPEVSRDFCYFPMFLLVWRASVIGMKYAYMPCTDIASIRCGRSWRNSMLNFRSLGTGVHFDTLGTLSFDILSILYMSSLRCDLLEELATSWSFIGVETARSVWDKVHWNLRKADDPKRISKSALFPGASKLARSSSSGVDVQQALLLDDFEAIEAQVAQGWLPVAAIAYYLVSLSYKSTPKAIFFCIVFIGMSVGLVMPAARALTGEASFGSNREATVALSVRAWVVGCGMFPSTLFMSYPVLDAWKRYCLSKALLAMYGDKHILGHLSQPPALRMELRSVEDLRNLWILSRILGPTLNIGLSKRYGSAYVLVLAIFSAGGLVLLYIEAHTMQNDLPWGFAAELVFFGMCGALAIFVTASICTAVNMHLDSLLGLVRRAAVNKISVDERFKDLAEAIAEDIAFQHGRLHPIRVAYLPASPENLLIIRSALTAFILGFIATIQQAYSIRILPR